MEAGIFFVGVQRSNRLCRATPKTNLRTMTVLPGLDISTYLGPLAVTVWKEISTTLRYFGDSLRWFLPVSWTLVWVTLRNRLFDVGKRMEKKNMFNKEFERFETVESDDQFLQFSRDYQCNYLDYFFSVMGSLSRYIDSELSSTSISTTVGISDFAAPIVLAVCWKSRPDWSRTD